MRDYKLYLTDIITSIRKINSYVAGYEYESFLHDPKTHDAVLQNLLIIGEAENRIPPDIKKKHNTIDWRGMIGMRNIIAHGYFTVDSKIIWKTIQENLPELLKQLEKIP